MTWDINHFPTEELLRHSTRKLKKKFYMMLTSLLRKMEEVPVHMVLSKLPNINNTDCDELKSILDIFMYNSPYYSRLKWYDLTLLHSIVECGDEGCKKILEEYRQLLFEYLQRRKLRHNNDQNDCGRVFIACDKDWDMHLSTEYICSLFGPEVHEIVLDQRIA